MKRLARRLEALAVRWAGAGLRRLPARTVVALRERLWRTVRLDYPRREILLSAGSAAVLGRARACRKEPETVEWIENVLEPEEVLFDIGANVGAYALVAWAATGGTAMVVAFEPSVLNFANLVENTRLNDCRGRVVPLPVALGDSTRLDTLHHSGSPPAQRSIGSVEIRAFPAMVWITVRRSSSLAWTTWWTRSPCPRPTI